MHTEPDHVLLHVCHQVYSTDTVRPLCAHMTLCTVSHRVCVCSYHTVYSVYTGITLVSHCTSV